ncbi:shikimate kinase [Arthrobacter sp. NPDC097144]|uniref:shikimate kinase n=1 Tax=Arthrobacter sp. NPDC097144 TaxID=3363946 RepID=UPI003820B775
MVRSPALVLIGPAAVGKTTVGELVAAQLGLPFVDLDEIGERYYAEIGWSIQRLVDCTEQFGRVAAEREWEPARAHAVRRAVEDHPESVMALGAGHTSFYDPDCVASVTSSLAPVPNVVLILPSPDRSAALAELRRRSLRSKETTWISAGHDFLAEWHDDVGTRSLATDVVFTAGNTPQGTAEQIVANILQRNRLST